MKTFGIRTKEKENEQLKDELKEISRLKESVLEKNKQLQDELNKYERVMSKLGNQNKEVKIYIFSRLI